MKATGLELKQFYQDWPPGEDFYIDGSGFEDENGNWILEPDEVYEIKHLGVLGWQGKGGWKDEPKDECLYTLEYWFEKWKVGHVDTILYVTLPDNEVEAFRILCAQHGWKVS